MTVQSLADPLVPLLPRLPNRGGTSTEVPVRSLPPSPSPESRAMRFNLRSSTRHGSVCSSIAHLLIVKHVSIDPNLDILARICRREMGSCDAFSNLAPTHSSLYSYLPFCELCCLVLVHHGSFPNHHRISMSICGYVYGTLQARAQAKLDVVEVEIEHETVIKASQVRLFRETLSFFLSFFLLATARSFIIALGSTNSTRSFS